MPSAKSIAAAIQAIPAKKEDLKKAYEDLQAHASSLSSFTLLWKDLEDHISFIERSIEDRFSELESKEGEHSAAAPPPSEKEKPAAAAAEPEVEPRPELRALCVKMDGKGLLLFINENRKDLTNIRRELNRAIRAASNPAKMILDAMDGFYPVGAGGPADGELHAHRRTCILLLERLHVISPEIPPPIRERAKKLAREWQRKISKDGGQKNVEILAFMQLLASYGVISEFEADDILDLLVPIAKRKQVVDLCRDFGLSEKMPDFIEKLSSMGKQIDAVKFVYAFELVDKFPPAQLLKEYVKESKKVAQEVRKKGHNSAQSQNEATAKEVAALRAVIKTIEEYKLESEYSPESLQKRVTQLEQQKAEKKRPNAAMANPKGQAKQQQANKRPRPSAAATKLAAHPPAPLPQAQPQHPLVDRVPFMASTGPYGLSGSSYLYEHASSAYTANPLGLGATRSPPRSYLHSDPLLGSSLYDRSGAYGGYSLSGGLPPQYNSSLYR